ncbi:MAG: hypothetical protein JKX76_01440 [Colwellia sp.]|nr:hypothetical protein [Colwellia sp.]
MRLRKREYAESIMNGTCTEHTLPFGCTRSDVRYFINLHKKFEKQIIENIQQNVDMNHSKTTRDALKQLESDIEESHNT